MHEEHYGFTEKAFSLAPDPKYLFESESHARAFDLLQHAARRPQGLVVITGASGTGKTTLCRALADRPDRKTFPTVILNPFLSEDDLLRSMLQDFGVVSRSERKRGRLASVSRDELLDTLKDFLASLATLDAGGLLVVDDAQSLPLPVIEQLHVLSRLEAKKRKLLQVALVGQPGLHDVLRSPELRSLDRHVAVRYELKPLDRHETAAYIAHRIAIAGDGTPGVSFAPGAADRIHRYTGGSPRLINLVCDRALLGASPEGTARITGESVEMAASGLELADARRGLRAWMSGRAGSFAAGAAAMALVAAVTYAALAFIDARASSRMLRRGGDVVQAGVPGPANPSARPEARAAEPHAAALPPVAAPTASTPQPAPTTAREGLTATAGGAPIAADAPAPRHRVLVASFRHPQEAASLGATLRELGYQVRPRRIDSGERGVWHQVLVGPYADLEEARRVEGRIKQLPGYDDARLITR